MSKEQERNLLYFTLGAISMASLIVSWTFLDRKRYPRRTEEASPLYRFDIDHRFTDAVRYDNLVFMSGQVGEGSSIEEQTKSALGNVDLALGMRCVIIIFIIIIYYTISKGRY